MGLAYGVGNLGKILGPLGLALIVGSTNYVSPKATLDAIFPALLYLAFWYAAGRMRLLDSRHRNAGTLDRGDRRRARQTQAGPATVRVAIVRAPPALRGAGVEKE